MSLRLLRSAVRGDAGIWRQMGLRRGFSARWTPEGSKAQEIVAPAGDMRSPTGMSSRPMLQRRDARDIRELPTIKKNRLVHVAFALLFGSAWAAFVTVANNNQRADSSVVRSLEIQLKYSPKVHEFVGEGAKIPRVLGWLKWVTGNVNTSRGRIELSFDVAGARDKAKAHFVALRPELNAGYLIHEWTLTRESDGAVLSLKSEVPHL